MPRRNLAEDRFKPTLAERLKQSAEAKKRRREPKPRARVLRPEISVRETLPTGHGQIFTGWAQTTAATITVQSSASTVWDTWIGQPMNAQTLHGITVTAESAWRDWQTAGTTTGNTITCNDCWDVWVDDGTTGGHRIRTGGSGTTWNTWISANEREFYGPRAVPQSAEARRVREEREAGYAAEREAYYQRERKAAQEKRVADERAMELLMGCLNPEQQDSLKKNQFFLVTAPSKRLYRIDQGTHGNVKVLDPNTRKVVERLCIQPNGVPAADSMLMQKLMIETAEDIFRRHANITLADGRVLHGEAGLLDGEKLAKVIPLRKAA